MNRQQIQKQKQKELAPLPYQLRYWDEFDYGILNNIMYRVPPGNRKNKDSKKPVNDIIIMLDTETSKLTHNEYETLKSGVKKVIPVPNIVVCWSIALRAYGKNIVTLYGRKPSDICKCLEKIHNSMEGEVTYVFVHNLAYDWVFIRKFLLRDFGKPKGQLNTKPHYPLTITFHNGIILRDSLILAQRSIEKWGEDLNVPNKKAVGMWDYNKIRTQFTPLDLLELLYIQGDVLCGVECIDYTMQQLKKTIVSLPFTATGIPRGEVRKRAKENNGHKKFLTICPDYETHKKLEQCYHGGFTHGNRHFINTTMKNVQGFDFASSYPFCMLSEKFPMQKFRPYRNMEPEEVINLGDKFAFIVRLVAMNVCIKNDFCPMPPLQFSKCTRAINPVLDNGRILSAGFVEIWLTETDLKVIRENYTWTNAVCLDVEYSFKHYLPRWFTDYIYQCFVNKTKLKGGDAVAYALSKSTINALY